jgi:hypothetical protein
MAVTIKAIALGIATHIPGLGNLDGKSTGGTSSARYCYAVWMRHLIYLNKSRIVYPLRKLVELGPGDSIGVGLAAMLTGVEHYTGLDAKPYATVERNLRILDELAELFRARAPIPDEREFPGLFPRALHTFPDAIMPAEWDASLSDRNLDKLRQAICEASASPGAKVRYLAPWQPAQLADCDIDLTISQTVMQLMDDLPDMYRHMARWTKPGGFVSHEIDLKSYGRTREWDGHWACSDTLWNLMQRKRTNQINREYHSRHILFIESAGFEVVADERDTWPSTIGRMGLSPRFMEMTDSDMTTSSVLIQAVRT